MIINKIEKAIINSNNTAIVCHHNPDGDTLGSAFALCRALQKMNKTCEVLCADKVPSKYSFLDKISILNEYETSKYDLVIFVDCAELHLTGTLFENHDITNINTINIDHHATNSLFAGINHVLSDYSSTAEVILELIKEMNIDVDKEIAEYLYIGIVTDTGQFAYSYTSEITHRHAAYLLGLGIEFSKINKLLFNTISLAQLFLKKRMLSNLKMHSDNKIAISLLSTVDFNKSGALSQDSDSLVNILLSVNTVKAAVLLRQIDSTHFKASFRSSDDIDISKVAKSLNGGGHKQAAGATIECTLDEAIKVILSAIDKANIL